MRFTNGTRSRSILCPMKPSMAGSSVTDASITTSTADTAPTASPRRKPRFITNRPSSEMITVQPAKITARPEVVIDVMTAARGSSPLCSAAR